MAIPHPRAFSIPMSQLEGRFDASYHVPIARTIIELLQKATYAPVQLGQLASNICIRIPPRFKRIYVNREYGIPFLRPSQLSQLRPYDLGYISKLTKELEELKLHLGEILVTTDGTVGRVATVTPQINNWAGSNNIARITYGIDDNRNGYVAAFLDSAYGYYQLTRHIYGGVIDHIEVPHLQNILIPNPPDEVQRTIGQKVMLAYEKKDQATLIEEAAIRYLEKLISRQ